MHDQNKPWKRVAGTGKSIEKVAIRVGPDNLWRTMPERSILELIFAWADSSPDQEAVVFHSSSNAIVRLTYAELREAVRQRAQIFRDLKKPSRIGLVAAHGTDFLIQALAILETGNCLVPIGEHLSDAEKNELSERAGIHARCVSGVLKTVPVSAPIDCNSDEDFRSLDPAYLRFTSGSTGQRKGVLLGHQTILDRTDAANGRLKISPSDRVLCLLPMVDHFVVSILLYLRFGATVLLVANDESAPEFAATQMASVLYGSPVQYRHFENPLPHVRLAVSTTQGLSLSLAESFLAKTGRPLAQALGIIEAGLLTLNDLRAATDPLVAGEPMPTYQISVAGNRDAPGEVFVAGPGLLDAYVAPWRPRQSLLTERGFPTGDHGWMDEMGCLHLVGRGKNRIEVGSVSFFAEEIEARLNRHPLISESRISLRNNGLLIEVVASDDPDLAEWVRRETADLETPVEIQFVQSLPKTATGKLARQL